MKELTKEQIQKVENYLDRKRLNYIDVRMEVLDHMLSSIEQKLLDDVHFDRALKTTIQEWNKELKPMSSWALGLAYIRPKIIIQKVEKNFLIYFLVFLSILIVPITSSLQDISFSENNKKIILSTAVILIITISTLYLKMLRTNIKTTYLFLFEKCTFYMSLFSFFMITISFSSNDASIFTTFSLLLFCYFFFAVYFFKKHQKINLLWN